MFVLGTQAIITLMIILSALIVLQIVLMLYLLIKIKNLQKPRKSSCGETYARLHKYIKTHMSRESPHSIKSKLFSAGWPREIVENAFKKLK